MENKLRINSWLEKLRKKGDWLLYWKTLKWVAEKEIAILENHINEQGNFKDTADNGSSISDR